MFILDFMKVSEMEKPDNTRTFTACEKTTSTLRSYLFLLLLMAIPNIGRAEEEIIRSTELLGTLHQDRLEATISRDEGSGRGLENVYLTFNRIRNGKIVASKTADSAKLSFSYKTVISVGDFMRNGRKQILVWVYLGGTEAQMFDFDGNRLSVVYDTDKYDGPRIWVTSLNVHGTDYIVEEWTRDDFSEPGFSLYNKELNTIGRVLRWQDSKWMPIRFRLVDGTPELLR